MERDVAQPKMACTLAYTANGIEITMLAHMNAGEVAITSKKVCRSPDGSASPKNSERTACASSGTTAKITTHPTAIDHHEIFFVASGCVRNNG